MLRDRCTGLRAAVLGLRPAAVLTEKYDGSTGLPMCAKPDLAMAPSGKLLMERP